MARSMRLIVVGFGSVGQGLAQILRDRGPWLAKHYGINFPIVGVATRRGCAYDPAGLDPAALLAAGPDGLASLPTAHSWQPADLVAQAEADVLVEVSSTDLASGEPATALIRAAFAGGLHVVTANKGPLALHGRALLREAANAGVTLGYEGTVMSGTPALRLGWSALAGCEISAARGILNGTTNYILTEMERGLSYADALADAQRLGYAETDPTGDVEGHDAAGKALILANMLLDAGLRLDQVACTGITHLTPADIAAAQQAGERWKLIAEVVRVDGIVHASVAPRRIPLSHPLASVAGATNAISYSTDLLGEITLIGPGAGGVATGFALLSDLLALPH